MTTERSGLEREIQRIVRAELAVALAPLSRALGELGGAPRAGSTSLRPAQIVLLGPAEAAQDGLDHVGLRDARDEPVAAGAAALPVAMPRRRRDRVRVARTAGRPETAEWRRPASPRR